MNLKSLKKLGDFDRDFGQNFAEDDEMCPVPPFTLIGEAPDDYEQKLTLNVHGNIPQNAKIGIAFDYLGQYGDLEQGAYVSDPPHRVPLPEE